jgi:hypothetical protein
VDQSALSVEETVQASTASTANQRTFEEFVAGIRTLLEGAAAGKGYSANGVNGRNPLYEFVHGVVGGPQHAVGECIYKLVRYQSKRNPEDLLKAACWSYLIWRNQ